MKKTANITLILILLAGFLFLPETYSATTFSGMFDLYEDNRAEGIPNYITEDFILLSYSMMMNKTVTQLEEALLCDEFKGLTGALIKKIESEKSEDEIAKANLDYLKTLDCLLSGKEKSDSEPVTQELGLIREAKDIKVSNLMKQKIDYSQFKVRGKYTQTDKLGWYFQAMKYAGTVLFPVKESKATGITKEQADFLTRQAVSLICLIHEDASISNKYKNLVSNITWLFGRPDDLTSQDLYEKGNKKSKWLGLSSKNLTHKDYYKSGKITDDDISKLREKIFDHAKKEKRQPSVISGFVNSSSLEKESVSAKDVMTGWRFIPQTFTPDSAAFQMLVFDQVKGEYQGNKTPFSLSNINGKKIKGFPLGLELMAILGSKEAEKRLKDNDEKNYKDYDKAFEEAQNLFKSEQEAFKKEKSSISSWYLYIMKDWLTQGEPDEKKRRLNTSLSFWTYSRYINILYAKQSYTIVSKSFKSPSDKRTIAYLKPAASLYKNLSDHIGEILERIKGKDEKKFEFLKEFKEILNRCHNISSEEIKGRALTKDDYDFLNNLDKNLFKIIGNKDYPIIADVHTETVSGLVLEEGLGYPKIIPKKIGETDARGALFTYYEFKHPMNDRLTIEKWQEMLADEERMKKLELSPGSSKK